uniref:ANK_REP_REGION domain-containing protein n=1 Tax=Caenorhabditis tropicalis TaxID=1561998 RepID=A0A1I7U767_9PELO
MGTNSSKVVDGGGEAEKIVQTISENKNIYKMVDMHGGGVLIKLARKCKEIDSFELLDAYIDQEVRKYMYNGGKGKLMPIAELVKERNKERNAKLGAFSRKKGKGKSGPNILDEFDQAQAEMAGDLKKALKLLDGGGKGGKAESKYREMVWSLEDRGLSPLHLAIVNQDAQFTSLLLRLGADLNQRCYGAFFCADDQKASRTDSLEHEFVELTKNTNYTGRKTQNIISLRSMYFGEYPLSFAVCMGHHDLFRMLLAKKANLNAQDTNGNTALHLCVIHDKMDMLDAVLDAGGNVRIANKQNLTPLTLAARLAKKTMFDKILQLECEKVWTYGASQCVAIPLTKIDTIDETTGEMNDTSALSLVVYGESTQHLELMDGLIEQILDEKWKAYGRALWLRSLLGFIFFYCCFVSAYMLRPSSATTEHITRGRINDDGETESSNSTNYLQWHPIDTQCHLMYYSEWPWYHGWFRLVCEIMTLVVMLFQILFDLGDIRRIGFQKWFNFLKAFPAKLMFKGAFLFILISIPCRFACSFHEIFLAIDNTMAIISVLLVTQHFLYYMRAIPFVGPFVLMVYTIIATDLVRFAMIYSIFLVGFSQSFYLIFTSCERASTLIKKTDPNGSEFNNIMVNPIDALLRTFIMTIGEFSVLYREMAACDNFWMKWIGKIIFLIFETFVSILQFNLLIAMMTRTYETIFLTRKEWKRQWAQVILMLEMGLTPESRKMHLLRYTRPTGINKRVRSYVVVSKGDGEKTEKENWLQERQKKNKNEKKENNF